MTQQRASPSIREDKPSTLILYLSQTTCRGIIETSMIKQDKIIMATFSSWFFTSKFVKPQMVEETLCKVLKLMPNSVNRLPPNVKLVYVQRGSHSRAI